MSTIQIADKTTLDNTKTNTTNLLTKGGIKYNATSQKYQTYNTTNSSWVDTEFGGGGGKPTLIVKNTDGILNNKTITVSNTNFDYTNTKAMGTNEYLVFDVPLLSDYMINWDSKTKQVSVASIGGVVFDPSLKIVSFADGTDEELVDMLDAYYNDEITWAEMGWAIGDTRIIHLDKIQAPNPNSSNTWAAQDIAVVIVDHDHTDLATAINGHNKACITVQTREVLSGVAAGNLGQIYIDGNSASETTFTKWINLYMRKYLNSEVLYAFPRTFKAAIKPSTHYRHTSYNSTSSEQVTDNLFLPSYPEIYGTTSYTYYTVTSPVEGTQFKYYQTSSNRIKYINNNGKASSSKTAWWTGSASSYISSNRFAWCTADSSGGANNNMGGVQNSLAPAWAM